MNLLKLPLAFDENRLRQDLQLFGEDDWTPHFNTQYYDGEWSGIALRAAKDAHVGLYPDPTAEAFVDTEMLARCSYVPSVLAAFKCEIESARFLRLTAGSEIKEHRDYKLGFEDGVARLHIPIVTDQLIEFYLDGQRVDMRPGEVWYLNFNLKHRVVNRSPIDRVHLVIDLVLNDWLRSFFAVESLASAIV
jgi:aspartyl/asparaginyl beta-hydroxylase (cupin superfamily)